MSIKSLATLALATGFAAASPIAAPQSRNNNNIFGQGFNGAIVNGFNGNGFNFIDGFNNFNQQQQVLQIQEQNLQVIDNGFRQQVIQQVNQVLVVDQINNGFNNDLNNLFRKSNFQNQFRDVATVMMVVQEIRVAVDDGRGRQFQQNIFAQSVVVANRGARQTQSVMVFDKRVLVAQDVLRNNAFGNLRQFGGVAGASGALDRALPTKTAGIQLFGARPTWSAVAEDPAAVLGGIWQQSLQDLQRSDNDASDNKLNEQLAAQERQKLDEAVKQLQDQKKNQGNNNNNNKDQDNKAKQQQEQEKKDSEKKDQEKKDQEKKDQEKKDQEKKDQANKDQATANEQAKQQSQAQEKKEASKKEE